MSNFFTNLGIGKKSVIDKWIKEVNPSDIKYGRVELNDKMVFDVNNRPCVVFRNLCSLFNKGELNECIIYDFKIFNEVEIESFNIYFVLGLSLDSYVDMLNQMNKHIINLNKICIISQGMLYNKYHTLVIRLHKGKWKVCEKESKKWFFT